MAAAVSALDFESTQHMTLDTKIRSISLGISDNHLARMSIADKRILWDSIKRVNPQEVGAARQYFRMADTHSYLFTNLNFNSFEDFVRSITETQQTMGQHPKLADIQYVGYCILQKYFIEKILNIGDKLKQLPEPEDANDVEALKTIIRDRLIYFNSDEFIKSLSNRPPDKTDANSKDKTEGSYSNFLNTIFQTSLINSKIDWRNVIESPPSGSPINAQGQCEKILRSHITNKTHTCYICGTSIAVVGVDKKKVTPDLRGYKTGECEHLLPILLAVENLWICKERAPGPEYRDALQIEYKWSHRCCNRVKGSLSLIWYNWGANELTNVYSFDKRAGKGLLDLIISKAVTANYERSLEGRYKEGKEWVVRPAEQGKGVTNSDCLQIYDNLIRAGYTPDTLDQWKNDRLLELEKFFTPIAIRLNTARVYTNVQLSLSMMGTKGIRQGGQRADMGVSQLQQEGFKEMYNRFKLIAAISDDVLGEALVGGDVWSRMPLDKGVGLGKSIIGNKKLIKKELQKSNSKLKKLLDIGNRLKLGLDYRNKKYNTKNNNSLFNFKLNYMRKSLGNEILDSIKNITNKKSLDNWIDKMFLKIKNLPKDRKEFETSVKKNHKQLSQVDDKVKTFNIKDKKNKAKGIKKKKYITVNIKLYPKLKTIPKLAFIPISLVSSKILTSLNKLNIENYKLIELKTSVSNDLSYFLIEFNLDIDKKYDKNLINSQIKNLFNNESFLLDINENSISSFPIFDKVNVSISNLNNKTKNKHSRGKGMRSKGMRSKGMRIRKAKGIRKTNKTKKTKKTKKKRKN